MRIEDGQNKMIINSNDDLMRGINELSKIDPSLEFVFQKVGTPPLRRTQPGFETLARIIIAQQISRTAADAISMRLEQAGLIDPKHVAQASDIELVEIGLSTAKARYLRALSRSSIDFEALSAMPDVDVVKTLSSVDGIGRWTAEIYLISALGRCDIFPSGDLALRKATGRLLALEIPPSEATVRKIAVRWSPWRSVAARLLWAYYSSENERKAST